MKLILIIVAVIVAYLVWYKMKGPSLESEQAAFMKLFRAGDRFGSQAAMIKIKEKYGIAPFPVDLSVPPPNTEIVWGECGDDKTIDECFAHLN